MSAQRLSPPSDGENTARKRCDGSSPCSRCRSDNAICVFGERKKAQDKIYPKGYVEMLEQQQAQLVNALQEMYKRLTNNEGWKGDLLEPSPNGNPLTHDILVRLDALEIDGHLSPARFEEDTDVLQRRFNAVS
ncbi:MAG: hypothetical protein LQ344_005081 [Seirophora lacunosa]|nr:MAG: hypothetical protein LQ344_005081 [Seirophora lacunosa]